MDTEKQHEETCLCPDCGAKYRVPKEFLGRSITCKQCGNRFELHSQQSDSIEKSSVETVKHGDFQEISYNDPLLAIGKLAVQYKFVTKEQVKTAFIVQQKEIKKGSRKPLGEIMIEQGIINQSQLRYLLAVQELIDTRQLDRRFGEMVVDKGFAGSRDIEKALEKQKQLFEQAKIVKPIGDILVASKILKKEQRDAILLQQQRVPRPAEPLKPVAAKTSSLDQWLELTISEDRLSALLNVKEQAPPLDPTVIKEYLSAKGIVQGLATDLEIMDYFLDQTKRDKPLLAASGVEPEKGLNEQLFLQFQHKGAKPESIPDLVCLEQTGIKSVKKDDLLAEKKSAVSGKEGIDVFGRSVPPPTNQDFSLQAGRGTRLSEDGRKVYAESEGLPQLTVSGKVMVVPHLFIPGDVGVETGNIDFAGRVDVHSAIQNGYKVKCEQLTAREAFRAQVETTGDVEITDGINGTVIRTRGNVRAKFFHRASIEAFGDVTAEREIIDSKIEIGGVCKIKNGIIVSSKVTAMKGIVANQVGTKTGNASTLFVGVDTRFRNEMGKFKSAADLKREEQQKVRAKLDELEAKDLEITQKIGDLAQQQDSTMVTRRKLQVKLEELEASQDIETVQQIKAALMDIENEIRERDKALEGLFIEQDKINQEVPGLQKTMSEFDAAIEKLEAEIKVVEDWLATVTPLAEIKVTGTIYAETMLKGNKASLLLPETFDRVQIKEIKTFGADKKMDLKFRITRLE